MRKEYIVGVDFGHGETSAWIVPINSNDDGMALSIRNASHTNEKVCPSWVYKTTDGYSLSLHPSGGSLFVSEFKMKPEILNQDASKRAAYLAFVRLVIEALLKNNTDLVVNNSTGDTNFYLCVASPTRWSNDEKIQYLELFREAMAPLYITPMWIINESDAAYFSFNNNKDCTLVIDYGSSTIDYTLMMNGHKVSNDSWSNAQLGASSFEKAIVSNCKSADYKKYQKAIQSAINECSRTGNPQYTWDEIESYLLRDIRVAKETVFILNTWPRLGRMTFSMYDQCGGPENGYDASVELKFGGNLQDMEEVVQYMKMVEDDFVQLKKNVESKVGRNTLKRIILSGGACQMSWVRDLVKRLFGEDIKIEYDNESSYVVSKGIAKYARAQLQALNELHQRVTDYDYGKLFTDVDQKTTAKAIEKLAFRINTKIDNLPEGKRTGSEIRNEFLSFLYGLDGRDSEYRQCFVSQFRESLNSLVYILLRDVLRTKFGKEIGSKDILVDYTPVMYIWPGDCSSFSKEDGAWYGRITEWILEAADECGIAKRNSIFNLDAFGWSYQRDLDTRRRLASIVLKKMIYYFSTSPNAIAYDLESVKRTAAELQMDVLSLTDKIFYEQQLFQTTYLEK